MEKNQKLIGSARPLKTIIPLFAFLCVFTGAIRGTDVTARPYEIKFDYDGSGYTNDAITILDEGGDEAPVPEWEYNGGSEISEKFAYIKSQGSRKIQVRFDSNCSSMHLIINLNVTSGTGIGEVCNYFVANYNDLGWVTLDLDGTIPGSVGKRDFTWEWKIYAIPTDASGYCSGETTTYTEHTYYTVLAAPQAPMEEPWTNVLDYACDWASGETTVANAATEITESLFASGFDYETESGTPRYGNNWNTFELIDFLSELGNSYDVNCLDMGKAVTTFGNALGCDLYLTTFSGAFALNCIDPIGTPSPTNNTFSSPLIDNDCRTGGFGYHAFSQNASKVTWDACLKYDIDGNPDNVYGSNPSCGSTTTGYTWKQPCGESESTYIQRLADDWTYWENCSNRYNCGYFTYNISISVE